MTVKEWLNRGMRLNDEINSLIEKQQKAFSIVCKTTPAIVQDKVQACGGKSKEDCIVTYIDYTEQINSKIDELHEVKAEILNAIKKVDKDTYKALLILRYVKFKSWGKIAKFIGKDRNSVKTNIHRSALNAITQYIV